MNFFNHLNGKKLLQQRTRVKQLDHDDIQILQDNHYLVGPKADGYHAMLLYNSDLSTFHLISDSHLPQRIDGTYEGEKAISFLLEAEVITTTTGSREILVYDICAIDNRCVELHHLWNLDLMYQGNMVYSINSFLERSRFLNILKRSIHIPELHLKPVADTNSLDLK